MKEKSEESDESKKGDSQKSQPDYYFENGLMVMTAAYHLKRGYCCGSGCRHCPYPKEESQEEEKST